MIELVPNLTYSKAYQKAEPMFSVSRCLVLDALGAILDPQSDPAVWAQRWEIEAYVHECILAGFATSADHMRNCAQRFIAGKRKITPPGTARRLRDAKKLKEMLANTPPELLAAVRAVVAEQTKAVEQYRSGIEKALNSLVGGVMKKHKADPTIVRELLVKEIKG